MTDRLFKGMAFFYQPNQGGSRGTPFSLVGYQKGLHAITHQLGSKFSFIVNSSKEYELGRYPILGLEAFVEKAGVDLALRLAAQNDLVVIRQGTFVENVIKQSMIIENQLLKNHDPQLYAALLSYLGSN